MRPADWSFVLDTLELSAAFDDGELKFAAEVRHRERALGTTFNSLRALRIRYVEAGSLAPMVAGAWDDYRDLRRTPPA